MRSMTGYSKIAYEDENFSLRLEIKGINNKNLNLKIKSPYSINFLENSIRTEISSKVTRGSIDLKIDFRDKREIEDQYIYDEELSCAYMNILKKMEEDFSDKFTSKMDILVRSLNVIQKKDFEIDEEEYSSVIFNNLNKLLDGFIKAKEAEGFRLREYFIEKVSIIENKVSEINKYSDKVVINHKTMLLERLNKIKGDIEIKDEDILREILLYTDRCDISEELSRLDSHIIQLKEDISSNNPIVGKKIDFMLQEIFRELNTAGVKSNMYEISKLVVECKNEIERIREQVMNIE